MIPNLRWAGACALITALVLPLSSEAGVFSVTPVRLYMTVRDRAIAVTLTNDADTDVVLQADLNTWSQSAEGEEKLEPTDDLVLAPPIVKLGPRARQVVRLALLKPPDLSRQLTYRLIVREVPEALPKADNAMAVPIALALSMPVFITPPNAKREVTCTGVRDTRTPAVSLRCRNTGTAYAQIREATLMRGDQALGKFEGGTYILPGASKPIPIAASTPLPAGELKLLLVFDDCQNATSAVALP